MNDLSNETPQKIERNLNKIFAISVTILILLFALLASLLVYLQVKHLAIEQDLNHFNQSIADTVLFSNTESDLDPPRDINQLGNYLLAQDTVSKLAIYTAANDLIWSSAKDLQLNNQDKIKLSELLQQQAITSWVWDDHKQFMQNPSFNSFVQIIKPESSAFATLSVVVDANAKPLFAIKTLRDYSQAREIAMQVALVCFALICLCGLIVSITFSRVFRKSLNVIKSDETILNNQVAKLSMLLDENKELQKNMQSASSRAVELNERFLRRVGSDLHDGPAQSIGYALLRLNQVSSKQISEELGYEFHAVKEALSESIDEIRGISSGLVLPELEQMTLEEATRKVIEKHKMKTGTEVDETYLNLPDQVDLPIKICAYRFAQEGLNNAFKHGGAKKCRFTAQVLNGVLHLSLKDNGVGFRKSKLSADGGHLGLIGLKDRIESLGGKLNINSELGVGTAIKVSVKLSRL